MVISVGFEVHTKAQSTPEPHSHRGEDRNIEVQIESLHAIYMYRAISITSPQTSYEITEILMALDNMFVRS